MPILFQEQFTLTYQTTEGFIQCWTKFVAHTGKSENISSHGAGQYYAVVKWLKKLGLLRSFIIINKPRY